MCRRSSHARAQRTFPGLAALAACIALSCAAADRTDTRRWTPLAKDGIHDPRAPGLRSLQEPRDALRPLPPDTAGNQVRWVEAIEKGAITPRTGVSPTYQARSLDQDVYFDRDGSMPIVRFPHREHTLWLDCTNCHERLFRSQRGANDVTMLRILQGEQCGLCHGAVAFPLTECARCHNTPRARTATPVERRHR